MSSFKIDREKLVMEHTIDHARLLYTKCNLYTADLDSTTKITLRETISKILRKYLPDIILTSVFKFNCFLDVIRDSIEQGKFNGDKSSHAFTELEKYFTLLYSQPWKKEFHVLKLYSGFFNSRIKSHLSYPELIFIRVGYSQEGDSQMVLKQKPDRDLIFDVCFECLIAAVVCENIAFKYNEIKEMGGDIKDAYDWRQSNVRPNDSYLSKKLENKMSRDKNSQIHFENNYDEKNRTGTISSDSRSKPYSSDGLVVDLPCGGNTDFQKENRCVVASDIPFIDDSEYDNGMEINHKGTLDDHIHASLREVNLKEKKAYKKVAGESGWEFLVPKGQTVRLKEVDLKSIRKIETERCPCDSGDYFEGVYYPPSKAKTLPNLNKHNRTMIHHTAHDTRPVDYTDSCRSQLRSREASGGIKYHTPLLDVDGASYMSNYFDAPMDDNQLHLESLSSSSLPKSSSLKMHGGWSCSHCTTLNNAVENVCRSCFKSRRQGRDLEIPKEGDQKKVCVACTLENDPSAIYCTVCNAELKPANFQTYV